MKIAWWLVPSNNALIEKLRLLAELEQAYTSARQVQRLEISQDQRQQILRLANDLKTVWLSPTTTAQERKEML